MRTSLEYQTIKPQFDAVWAKMRDAPPLDLNRRQREWLNGKPVVWLCPASSSTDSIQVWERDGGTYATPSRFLIKHSVTGKTYVRSAREYLRNKRHSADQLLELIKQIEQFNYELIRWNRRPRQLHDPEKILGRRKATESAAIESRAAALAEHTVTHAKFAAAPPASYNAHYNRLLDILTAQRVGESESVPLPGAENAWGMLYYMETIPDRDTYVKGQVLPKEIMVFCDAPDPAQPVDLILCREDHFELLGGLFKVGYSGVSVETILAVCNAALWSQYELEHNAETNQFRFKHLPHVRVEPKRAYK